ncbi:MAG: amidohydrolase family protein [Deltaproteobacteria bacterium]|jgi:predicted TIM-barrel fold metal-dependent hydrolase|nr:amidohydrolase family protein [Deltaproteobacteria bacterium]
MSDLGYLPFDCDNHYYEAPDAFTRHVPKAMQPRCVQWAEISGRKHHIVGGKLSRAVANPTWNPIAKPGAIAAYLRGNPDKLDPKQLLADQREPLPDCYMDRDARIATLDEQGLEAMWLFPTLGVLYEELLKHDTEAVTTLFRAFNRWLQEDWGCNYKERIFASPYVSLCDVDFACEELEWALEQDARTVCMRPAAVHTPDQGPLSPANPKFDPFWARANEAGITVVIHAGDSGYTTHGYVQDGFSASGISGPIAPNIKHFNIERAAYDFLVTLCYERLFERFPNLRIASIENGAEFLPDLFRKLRQSRDRLAVAGYYKEDPGLLFKEHVWINPFWEDDVYEVEALMGADRVIFGSDWPHIEGMPEPLDYVGEISKFDDQKKRRILRDNVLELNERRPA